MVPTEISDLFQLSPPVLLVVGLNAVGAVLKRIPPLPNWTIPLILMALGGVAFPFIAEVGMVSYNCKNPEVLNSVFGVIIGASATGLHQGVMHVIDAVRGKKSEPDEPEDKPATKTPTP